MTDLLHFKAIAASQQGYDSWFLLAKCGSEIFMAKDWTNVGVPRVRAAGSIRQFGNRRKPLPSRAGRRDLKR